MEYWLFNTDETEPEGVGKFKVMLREQVVAAWGSCRKLGAEVTLNRPNPGDTVYFFRAGHGIIARAVATDSFSFESQSIFGEAGEFIRPVTKLQVLPEDSPITVGEIEAESDYQIPYRQIMARILNDEANAYLNQRFQRVPKARAKLLNKPTGVYQNFLQPDPQMRKRVEKAAVAEVTRRYEQAGWTVKTVETEKVGYDLHCTKGKNIEKAEVKGTSGREKQFIITANELAKASDSQFVLFLVTDALQSPKVKKYVGKQLLASFDFDAIQYRATPKAK